MNFNKGDILRGKYTKHPIVFLRKKDDDFFYGCIITHSVRKSYNNNIKLSSEHFEVNNSNGVKYEIQFENTHVVKLELVKKQAWGPFMAKGKLTNAGIFFIEELFKNSEPTTWVEYIKRTNS